MTSTKEHKDESLPSTAVKSLQPLADLKEYETQYFGFTPKSFIDGVYNAMVEYLSDVVEVTHKYFLDDERFKDQFSIEALQESSDRLFVHLRDAFDKAFDRLENYLMKNIFHIPSGIVLSEDKVHMSEPVTESMDQKLDNELEELREKIRNAQYVNWRLQTWLQDVDSAQHILDSLLAQLQKWQVVCREANVSDLGETISFVTDRTRQLLVQCNELKATQTERNNNEAFVMSENMPHGRFIMFLLFAEKPCVSHSLMERSSILPEKLQ